MSLISETIPCLLLGCAVVSKAVRLDHETQIRPDEVDPESIDVVLRLGAWETRFRSDREEACPPR
jgi:hypothetical protein